MQDIDHKLEDGYVETIASLEGGTLIPELDIQMREMVRLVKARGGTGKLTLTLAFKEGEYEGTMRVIPDLKVAPPAKSRSASLLFTNEQDGLTLDKPKQVPLFARQPIARKEPA